MDTETRGERRDARRRKRRRMGVHGRSLMTIQRVIARRGEQAKRRREQAHG